MSIACIPAYFDQAYAIRLFGLPERIATAPAAHSPWILYTSRIHAIGIMMLIFFAQGNYAAVDMLMTFLGLFGVVDVWVCLREGVPEKAWKRGLAALVVGLYGICSGTRVSFLEMSARRCGANADMRATVLGCGVTTPHISKTDCRRLWRLENQHISCLTIVH
jgi:hypothetical protein